MTNFPKIRRILAGTILVDKVFHFQSSITINTKWIHSSPSEYIASESISLHCEIRFALVTVQWHCSYRPAIFSYFLNWESCDFVSAPLWSPNGSAVTLVLQYWAQYCNLLYDSWHYCCIPVTVLMHSYLIFVMYNSRPGSVLGDCPKSDIGGTLKLYPLLAC